MPMSNHNLLSPVDIGNITLTNRIGMSALTRARAANTYPTKLMKRYYMQRAFGGAGLIVSESIMVSRQGWQWSNVPGLWDENHVSGWRDITDAVHRAGSKIYAQLGDGGRLAHPNAPQQKQSGEPVYAPSAIPAKGGKFRQIPGEPGYATPTPVDDPTILIQRYKRAAINARKAGFDGVELQASSGVLPAQFLDSSSNKREDKWGGTVENRARFGIEVLKALKEVFGADVGLKINPGGGHNDIGMPLDETLQTYAYFITQADKLKLSYITLVRYNAALDVALNGTARGTDHDVLKAYRTYIRQSKLFLNSGVTPEEGEALISAGQIDGIFIGARWISHPDLVHRVRNKIPLNVPAGPAQFYGAEGDEASWEIGYVDFPRAG